MCALLFCGAYALHVVDGECRFAQAALEVGNVQWFRGGLVFEAHRLLYHSSEGARTFQDL